MSATKRIGDLVPGDRVSAVDGQSPRVTHSAFHHNMETYPHRIVPNAKKVRGWYLIWRYQDGREAGGVFDPEDRVEVP